MMRRFSAVLTSAVVAISLTGCLSQPDPQAAEADMDSSQAKVVHELRDAVAALTAAGFDVDGLAGKFALCGSGMGPVTVRYSGGGGVLGVDGGVNERIEKVERVLVDAGWKIKKVGTGIDSRGEAHSRLIRNGLVLGVDASQLITDKKIPVIGVDDTECVKVTDDQYSDLPNKSQPITL